MHRVEGLAAGGEGLAHLWVNVYGSMRWWSGPREPLQQLEDHMDQALLATPPRSDEHDDWTRPAAVQSGGGGHRQHHQVRPTSAILSARTMGPLHFCKL